MWRGGCIIRSRFPGRRLIKEAYAKNPKLTNLLLDNFFRKAIKDSAARMAQHGGHRRQEGHSHARVFHGSSTFMDAYRSARLLRKEPAAAGAAGLFRRAQRMSALMLPTSRAAKFFHTNWTGHGGVMCRPRRTTPEPFVSTVAAPFREGAAFVQSPAPSPSFALGSYGGGKPGAATGIACAP